MPSNPRPIVTKYFTTWCAPCRLLQADWGRIVSEYKGRAVFREINTEKQPVLANQANVLSVPVVTIESNGRQVYRLNGRPPRAYQTLRDAIDAVLAHP